MCSFAPGQKDCVPGFSGMPDQAVARGQRVCSHVGAVPDYNATSDNGRAFDVRPGLNDCSLLDEDVAANQEGSRMDRPTQAFFPGSMGEQVGFQAGECLPDKLQALEKIRVLEGAQIKKIAGLEHLWLYSLFHLAERAWLAIRDLLRRIRCILLIP